MDPRAMVMIAVAVCFTAAFVVKVILDAVLRLRERGRGPEPSELERRLERMEAAIDAIAIEVERSSELQRFSARLQQESMREALPAQVARPVTPH